MKIITRFAPSPTGFLHIGGVRTALFNFIFAKKNKGKFIVRIEDTDRERSRKEYEEDILSGLDWLGIKYEELYRQSERGDIYRGYLQKLIANDKAYLSKESNAIGERREVIRFRNPNIKLMFDDLIRGEIVFETTELGDFVIAKSFDEPLYHLAAVVDDFEMNVSHVIRGEDHISNTPRQILIQRALGFSEVAYAHIPLILAADRSKLSKRKHGQSVSLKYYREQGILPEAMINFLSLLGWNPGNDKEILSKEDLISSFDLEKVQKGGAVFNPEKLDWLNRQYLKRLSPNEQQLAVLQEFAKHRKDGWRQWEKVAARLTPLIVQKIKKWGEIKDLIAQGEFDYFFVRPVLSPELIVWQKGGDRNSVLKHLSAAREIVQNLPDDDFNAKILKEHLMPYADREGRGEVLWPLRYGLTGQAKSPDLFSLAQILGKKETLERWQRAAVILKK